jgi:hypothetical protein
VILSLFSLPICSLLYLELIHTFLFSLPPLLQLLSASTPPLLLPGAGMGKPPPEMRRVVSKTVWEMVDICCHNLSGSAIKLHDRGRLTDDGLRLSLAVCRRLRQLLPSPSTYWHRLPPALSPFSRPGASGGGGNQQQQSALAPPPATNQPLELLLDWPPINLDAKAGPLDVTQFPPKLAASLVVDNLASAKTLQELLPALQGVVSICRRIRDRFESRGEVAGSKLHVLGLLHSCFAANLGAPCPSPAESRGGEGKAKKTSIPRSPWTMGAITAEFQEQAIDRILDCLCELAAASRSLPRTRATSALDIVAVGYLIASLDAVLLADVNAHGADADAKEQKSGRARTLLWQEHYANLGLCLEQFGGRRFADCTSGCPLDWPGAAVVRADVQAYLDSAATRGLSEDMGSKGQFMNWGGWGAEGEKETVYYLSNQMSPLDPSCEIFRKLAIAMGCVDGFSGIFGVVFPPSFSFVLRRFSLFCFFFFFSHPSLSHPSLSLSPFRFRPSLPLPATTRPTTTRSNQIKSRRPANPSLRWVRGERTGPTW